MTVHIDSEKAIFGTRGTPLDYPCELPDRPYLLLGDKAHEIDLAAPDGPTVRSTGQPVDDLLAARGSARLADRVASVAFGANRDMRNLAWKFSHYHDVTGRKPSGDLVLLPARIAAADVVACNIGYWGYVYAALLLHRPPALQRPYLDGASAPVAVLLLDEDQMHMLHESEGVPRQAETERPGVSCDVALIDVEVASIPARLEAQLYVLALPYLSLDGRSPVAFQEVATTGRDPSIPALRQEEIWEAIWSRLDLKAEYGIEMREGIDRMQAAAQAKRSGEGVDLAVDRMYADIRERISRELALIDEDDVARTAIDAMPGLLTPEQAWSFEYGRLKPMWPRDELAAATHRD
jgi:hypothetical protein